MVDIYVPATDLHCEASAHLDSLGIIHTVVLMENDEDFWEFYCDRWAEGKTFIVVEHDITPSAAAFDEMVSCPEPWCLFPYPYFVGLYHGTGFSKWSAEMIQRDPGLWNRVAQREGLNHPKKHWCSLDGFAQQESLVRMHQHSTIVGHSNVKQPSHGCYEANESSGQSHSSELR